MQYFGVPKCPYCKKRVNIIRTWSLKRQGEYRCPRCGGISNIYLSPLIYVIALLAIFAGGAIYFFHKFVLDDVTLDTLLHVFIPFAAFFFLSLFMVYLAKPIIKKVPKTGRGRRARGGEESYYSGATPPAAPMFYDDQDYLPPMDYRTGPLPTQMENDGDMKVLPLSPEQQRTSVVDRTAFQRAQTSSQRAPVPVQRPQRSAEKPAERPAQRPVERPASRPAAPNGARTAARTDPAARPAQRPSAPTAARPTAPAAARPTTSAASRPTRPTEPQVTRPSADDRQSVWMTEPQAVQPPTRPAAPRPARPAAPTAPAASAEAPAASGLNVDTFRPTRPAAPTAPAASAEAPTASGLNVDTFRPARPAAPTAPQVTRPAAPSAPARPTAEASTPTVISNDDYFARYDDPEYIERRLKELDAGGEAPQPRRVDSERK